MLDGSIAVDGERLIDLLNRETTLRVCSTSDATWRSVDLDEVCLVGPPPHASDPQRRVRRQKHRVRVEVGPCLVTGTAHLVPGSELKPYLLRTRQRFLPITEAWIRRATHDPSLEGDVDVVLANVAMAERLEHPPWFIDELGSHVRIGTS